ncbi:hypothetical protein BU26DRAFT_519310 [Trematosphaeria pertusa]|uniref:Uncharacterized protein n=1 Tax=Trematosphaeria pertusa TaxID=390896 RepID=A0A6A6IFG0_9PLEO|nr:uncharacterized protein BU26DRAFT_519310 [Trematosphaeria pertusa]KAF2249146.1 hypothetical protein BU26DRAFT_519310 [Trematosphaeria pertusa]
MLLASVALALTVDGLAIRALNLVIGRLSQDHGGGFDGGVVDSSSGGLVSHFEIAGLFGWEVQFKDEIVEGNESFELMVDG